MLYKSIVLVFSILCMARFAFSALLPKVLVGLVFDYLGRGIGITRIPGNAQIAVYNGGFIFWGNNKLHQRRFGEPRIHIYRSAHLDKISRPAPVDSNRVPLLGSINNDTRYNNCKRIAVSNDGETAAISLYKYPTYIIRKGMVTSFKEDDEYHATLISGDGSKALTYSQGSTPGTGSYSQYLVIATGISMIALFWVLSSQGGIDLGDRMGVTFLGVAVIYSLRALLKITQKHNSRFEVHDLDSCIPLASDIISGTMLKDASINFTRISTYETTIGTGSNEASHPYFRRVQVPNSDALTSIRIDQVGFGNNETIVSSMDGQTMVALRKDIGGLRKVILLYPSTAVKSLFNWDETY